MFAGCWHELNNVRSERFEFRQWNGDSDRREESRLQLRITEFVLNKECAGGEAIAEDGMELEHRFVHQDASWVGLFDALDVLPKRLLQVLVLCLFPALPALFQHLQLEAIRQTLRKFPLFDFGVG